MTVADRRESTGTATPIGAELGALLAATRARGGPRPLIAATLPIEELDPIALFAAARSLGLEAALWLQPAAARSIVGIGRAWAIEAGGPDRFALATAGWRELLAGARVSQPVTLMPGTGPVLMGGLGFSGRTPEAGDPWAPFGPASLVLPTFAAARVGPGATLTLALGPDPIDEPDPGVLQRQWDRLVRATGDLPDAVEASAEAALRIVEEHPDRPAWERSVGLYAGAVGRGRIDKVVLARRVDLRAAADLDVVAALRHLARTAPESTTFAFVRDGTTFLGATPERLVRTQGRSFETVALAGSAPRGRDAEEDARYAAALMASGKEREEHAIVVDMIRASLSPIVEALHVAAAPAILPLRHLQHLATPITGRLHEDAGLLVLAQRLHPTPAVGGMPRDVALALIAEHEGFDRGWYAGPIGWLGADGDGELVVALRSGLVRGAAATLFAGCGIVADSDPAREWEESRLKLRTMIAAFGGVEGDVR